MTSATVIGAGLAGCEAANTLANNGVLVTLIEQKPNRKSAAHKLDSFAELVCSNSLKSSSTSSAAGLLKAEMRLMGSLSLEAADICAVAAGGALAVDRLIFSDYITKCIKSNKNINIVAEQAAEIDDSSPVIVATGPLTDGELAVRLCELCGEKALSFYDAAAPIVSAGSIDMERVSAACRYGKGTDDYLNCFFDKAGYEHFWGELVAAKTAQLHSFDEEKRV
ncbi:MAG: methylenetetrahydrofolate--tRNA-(uracil(54)-C(5))-methyltransferase (FADH(2)-oxidizing) TrmFO [Oscillospiraceae bacterium]